MSVDAETLVDRRRLKRRLFFWRGVAIIAACAALIAVFATTGLYPAGNHIARVTINGIILDDPARDKILDQIAEDSRVKAVILSIDSPGGSTTGAEALYASVRKLAAKKPVVAVLGTLAASGGYVAAISADHIVSRGNTLTGSIGVIFQWTQLEDLLDKIGVQVRELKSAPLKAEPSPYHKPNPQALKAMEALISSSYDWFVGLVAERRNMTPEQAKALGDGRVFTGFQAVENGLVDEIGGEDKAVAWLVREKKLSPSLKVLDWAPPEEGFDIAQFTGRAMGEAAIVAASGLSEKTQQTKRLTLDGLTSLWHPE
ncbi:MAG: signal peptide peptidase SppA [Rhizobiales bacterium]|nr:signal peptide peptidase SppA [Hyphomicrobiales bacterium]